MILKYKNMEKFDGYMPDKPHFIQDDYRVSIEHEKFHIACGYGYHNDKRRGFRFGVDKKMYKVSCQGYMVESYSIGKSDNR